ncbi:13854_t:CDS:2 [Dentiscutata heterogama]|uniref:13854_t:CDS:1 n=1 Tax=Dentiscutata heterogama TaxID=1316150 RepID=A0ACA9LMY1_9GLOM|nr:13854_t:CDS:2 [Dentiscutata heterogama]
MFPLLNFATYPKNYSYLELIHLHDNVFTSLDKTDYYKQWNIRALIKFKWNTYGRRYYIIIWAIYSIFMSCFLIVSTIREDKISWSTQSILLGATIFFGFIHLTFEVRQFIHKPKYYISSPWNWIGIMVLAFAHSLHLLLRPTSDYSYNQPSNVDDVNNPWNLVSTYKIILPNGTVSDYSLIQTPNDNTNLFAWFSTSVLAVYFMLTGDKSSVTSWIFKNNWTLAILLTLFLFFTTIYLLNLFIALLSNAMSNTYNRESYLQIKGEILAEIELHWMLPHQRRNKNWFPEILYYEATLKKLKEYFKNDEILHDLLPAIKKIAGIEVVEVLNKDTELYEIKKIIKSVESKDMKKDIALHAIKKILESKDPNEGNTPNKNNAQSEVNTPNEKNAQTEVNEKNAQTEVNAQNVVSAQNENNTQN